MLPRTFFSQLRPINPIKFVNSNVCFFFSSQKKKKKVATGTRTACRVSASCAAPPRRAWTFCRALVRRPSGPRACRATRAERPTRYSSSTAPLQRQLSRTACSSTISRRSSALAFGSSTGPDRDRTRTSRSTSCAPLTITVSITLFSILFLN